MTHHVVVTKVDRATSGVVDTLGKAGVATVHEAAGRTGLIGPAVVARQDNVAIAGSAITVLCPPGDNLMIHAAVEVCMPGDVLVVATTSCSTDGMFGELLATSLMARGVRGLVIDAGVRDVAELRAMRFPVWSRAVHAQGTVKASPGSVNVSVVVDSQLVRPGDVIIADDDGVIAVPISRSAEVAEAARARIANEAAKRDALAAGTLGVDMYNLRPLLAQLGVRYVDHLGD